MGLPQLESCCFIFDLKTGNIIIGCFNALITFIMLVIMIVTAAELGSLDNDPEVILLGPEERAALTGAYALAVILVLLFLLKFIFDVIFVYVGIVMERAKIIKCYMIMWIVFFLLSAFIFFINITHYNAWHITIEVFYLVMNIYAILLYHSFYKLLNTREVV